MTPLLRTLERLSTLPFVVGSALIVPAPVALGLALGPAWFYLGIIAMCVCMVLVGGAVWYRKIIRELPLAVGRRAVTHRLDGKTAYGFRVQLGMGRALRQVRFSVRFEPDKGDAIELKPVLAELPVAVGAMTVVVVDRDGRCDGAGAFHLVVEGTEGGIEHRVEPIYTRDEIVRGRFAPAAHVVGRRLELDPTHWDAVDALEGADAPDAPSATSA